MIHTLKTWPEYFIHTLNGTKMFDIRKNDRNFQVGDHLILQEWIPEKEKYTGRMATRQVSYIFKGGVFGIPEDMIIMGIIKL